MWKMYVIKPGHSTDIRSDMCPLKNPLLYNDKWYNTTENTHEIWYFWRNGVLSDGTLLADPLWLMLMYSPFSDNCREEIARFMEQKQCAMYSQDEIHAYLDWIDTWKAKGADFYLSPN